MLSDVYFILITRFHVFMYEGYTSRPQTIYSLRDGRMDGLEK